VNVAKLPDLLSRRHRSFRASMKADGIIYTATCRSLLATLGDFIHRDNKQVWTLPMNRAAIRMRPDEESRFGDRNFKRPSLAKGESWLACMTANP
jgi:hypothetical protein